LITITLNGIHEYSDRTECAVLCRITTIADTAEAMPVHGRSGRVEGCGHGVWRDAPAPAFARLRQFIAAWTGGDMLFPTPL
jgi:pimeloyl-ACP methyl ester carboxylesterase